MAGKTTEPRQAKDQGAASVENFVRSADGRAIASAFIAIRSVKTRKAVVKLIVTMANADAQQQVINGLLKPEANS